MDEPGQLLTKDSVKPLYVMGQVCPFLDCLMLSGWDGGLAHILKVRKTDTLCVSTGNSRPNTMTVRNASVANRCMAT